MYELRWRGQGILRCVTYNVYISATHLNALVEFQVHGVPCLGPIIRLFVCGALESINLDEMIAVPTEDPDPEDRPVLDTVLKVR